MAPLARRWHRWHVVGTISRSLARFFFPDALLLYYLANGKLLRSAYKVVRGLIKMQIGGI